MKRLVFIILTTLFLVGQPSVFVFSQETETVQNETTELSKREQRILNRQQKKEEKAQLKEAKKTQNQQIEEPQEDNSENFQPQPEEEEIEILPVHGQVTEISNSGNTHSDNEIEAISSSEQEIKVSKNNEQPTEPFPTWGWFVIAGVIILIYTVYRFDKYLSQKFGHNVYPASIFCFLLSMSDFIFFLGLFAVEDGVLGEISAHVWYALFIVNTIILYIYNLRKTNWKLAIINVFLQVAGWIFYVIIVIIRKVRNEASKPEIDASIRKVRNETSKPETTKQSTSSKKQPPKTEYYCEYCGKSFKSVRSLTVGKCIKHPDGGFNGSHKLFEGSSKSEYTCKYCGRSFRSMRSLTVGKCIKHPAGGFKGPHAPAL